MQTFLPYSDFKKSSKILDYKRLGKQRVEAMQIYKALTEEDYGWAHHPAVKMWKGYEKALLQYGLIMCREWIIRGYKDNLSSWFIQQIYKHKERMKYPPWLGNELFHRSHQSNLLRKDRKFYRKHFIGVPSNLPYEWNMKSNQ